MKNLLIKLLLFVLFSTFSCQKHTKKGGIIEKDELAKVLADLQILEAQCNRISSNSYDTTRFVFNNYKAKIFKKHNIDSTTFAESFEYYATNKSDLIDIYDKAEKVISNMKSKSKK